MITFPVDYTPPAPCKAGQRGESLLRQQLARTIRRLRARARSRGLGEGRSEAAREFAARALEIDRHFHAAAERAHFDAHAAMLDLLKIVVGEESARSIDGLAYRLRAALKYLGTERPHTLHTHPADAAPLKTVQEFSDLVIREDSRLARGSALLELRAGQIEVNLEALLSCLAKRTLSNANISHRENIHAAA